MHFSKSKILIITLSLLLSTFFVPSKSLAFWGVAKKIVSPGTKVILRLGKVEGSLPESKIIELANMIQKAGDIKNVGKILGDMRLTDEVLEDTFMRIIVAQKKISKPEAEEIFQNLRGVKGLRTSLRKAAGISEAKTIGHLNEINIANSAAKNGFEVVSIGEKFDDGLKHITDIDLIMKKNGKKFAIEAKDYSPNSTINLDSFRADMDTLVVFKEKNGKNVIPVFSITNPPNNQITRKLLEKEAERRGIQLIYGSPDEQIYLIKQLSEIV